MKFVGIEPVGATLFPEKLAAFPNLSVAFAAAVVREGVSRSYFTRVVRLSYLAPDITQAILDGRQPRDLRYRIDFIKVIFHPIRPHRSETVLSSRGVDLYPPAGGGPAASASIGGEMRSDRS